MAEVLCHFCGFRYRFVNYQRIISSCCGGVRQTSKLRACPYPENCENFEKVSVENNNLKKVETKEANLNNKDKIGRNDPCYCGSGLKYKKCGMLDKCTKNS